MSKLDITFFNAKKPLKPTVPPARRFRPTSIVYWSRFFLAILAAIICHSLQLKDASGIMTAATIYIYSALFFRYVAHYGERELKGKAKYITLASGTYIFVWAMMWILLYTLIPY